MLERAMSQYPVYIPSKGRSDNCLTAKFLAEDGVPFFLVVEPQERKLYTDVFGSERVLVLPFRDRGSVIPARNWIKDHATAAGHQRHWQLDDNIRHITRRWKSKRIRCDAGVALKVVEDFTDRYENIAISGMNYTMFIPDRQAVPPFYRNGRVYSCSLILNSIPHRWRGRYNEDTDLCLQVLADGWCTALVNVFLVCKLASMLLKGGNTTALYKGDGRLKMARSLERLWPGVVSTDRRFRRPQHVIKDSWRRFDTPLKLRPDIDLSVLPAIDEYGIQLTQKRQIRSKELLEFINAEAPSLTSTGELPGS